MKRSACQAQGVLFGLVWMRKPPKELELHMVLGITQWEGQVFTCVYSGARSANLTSRVEGSGLGRELMVFEDNDEQFKLASLNYICHNHFLTRLNYFGRDMRKVVLLSEEHVQREDCQICVQTMK